MWLFSFSHTSPILAMWGVLSYWGAFVWVGAVILKSAINQPRWTLLRDLRFPLGVLVSLVTIQLVLGVLIP